MPVDAMNFDTKSFISEIKKRPALWNVYTEEYSNREIKQKCLEEIVNLFGGENQTEEEKLQLGRDLKRKWRNLKDCYAREKRRISNTKSKSAAKRKTEYRYFQLLSFLSECSTSTVTESSVEKSDSSIQEANQFRQLPQTRKRRKNAKEDPSKELINVTKDDETENKRELEFDLLKDEDKMFFLSLNREFKKVPEYLKLTTKKRILDVIYEACCENLPYPNVLYSSST